MLNVYHMIKVEMNVNLIFIKVENVNKVVI
jgi:hypothetical protein